MENLYFTVILLIAQLSTHIRHQPSFLGVRRTDTAHGLMLIYIHPCSRSSATCRRISSLSFGLIQYAGLFGRLAPGIRSIWCCISLIEGSPDGSSSENRSLNSFNRGSISTRTLMPLTLMVDTRAYNSCVSSTSYKKEDMDNREDPFFSFDLPFSILDYGLSAI